MSIDKIQERKFLIDIHLACQYRVLIIIICSAMQKCKQKVVYFSQNNIIFKNKYCCFPILVNILVKNLKIINKTNSS